MIIVYNVKGFLRLHQSGENMMSLQQWKTFKFEHQLAFDRGIFLVKERE